MLLITKKILKSLIEKDPTHSVSAPIDNKKGYNYCKYCRLGGNYTFYGGREWNHGKYCVFIEAKNLLNKIEHMEEEQSTVITAIEINDAPEFEISLHRFLLSQSWTLIEEYEDSNGDPLDVPKYRVYKQILDKRKYFETYYDNALEAIFEAIKSFSFI